MRYLSFVFSSIVLLSSCQKNEEAEFTSDVPDKFRTDISIYYYEDMNRTEVSAVFSYEKNDYERWPQLQMPSNSYVKFNGVDLVWQTGRYYTHSFEGKPSCSIEFKNYDGVVYEHFLNPPDTAYFVSLPDTVSYDQDFEFQVNAPLLDSNESSMICLDEHGDDYGCIYFGTGSLITLKPGFLDNETTHILHLYRTKSILNPDLPLGGGGITYYYVTRETFYSE